MWEIQAAVRGATLYVWYSRPGGGAALNDSLLSDSVHLVSAGLAPLLLMWDRVIGGADVVGFAALNVSPIYVLTSRGGRSPADLTENDRIASPAVKTAIQALVLMAAAEKIFGEDQANRLNTLTVTMPYTVVATADDTASYRTRRARLRRPYRHTEWPGLPACAPFRASDRKGVKRAAFDLFSGTYGLRHDPAKRHG